VFFSKISDGSRAITLERIRELCYAGLKVILRSSNFGSEAFLRRGLPPLELLA
jgi:hypothetical protein